MPVSNENFSSCCRLCLDVKHDSLQRIFSAAYSDSTAELVFGATGIKVTKHDKLTTLLCRECYLLVFNWSEYRKRCVANQTKLNSWYEKSQRNLMNQSIHVKEEPLDEDDDLVIILDQDEYDSSSLIKNEPMNNTECIEVIEASPDLPPTLSPNLPIVIDIPNQIDEETTDLNNQPDKIDFAAGLQLQTRRISHSKEPLTETEKFYITKYKMIYTVYQTNTCLCHNYKYSNKSKALEHIRRAPGGEHFAKFMCINCLIVYDKMGTFMKHRQKCPRSAYEGPQRVMRLKERPPNKYRLFQNFHCVPCQITFTFYEDFASHIHHTHLDGDSAFKCLCSKEFEYADMFKQHILKSCYLNHYCDLCLNLHPTLDEFKKHCQSMHEGDATPFMTVHSSFKIMNSNPLELDAPDVYIKPQSEGIDLKKIKAKSSGCPICGNILSNYNCLVKHISKGHKINIGLAKNMANKCYLSDDPGPPVLSVANGDVESSKKHRKKPGPKPKTVIKPMSFSTPKKEPKEPNPLKKFICHICDQGFTQSCNLSRHQRHVHKLEGKNKYRCLECSGAFENLSLLETHRSENHTFVCLDCGHKCKNKKDLEHHRKSHLKLSITRDPQTHSYRSSAQSKSPESVEDNFDGMPRLTLAVAIDDRSNKLHPCSKCGKAFARRGDMKKHVAIVHRAGYPRKCEICERVLGTLGAYILHMKTHDTEKQVPIVSPVGRKSKAKPDDEDYYTCKHCFKVCTTKSNYKMHLKSHTSKSPTKANSESPKMTAKQPKKKHLVYCKHCKIPFDDTTSLNEHMQEEHEEVVGANKKLKMLPVENGRESKVKDNLNRFQCHVCLRQCLSGQGLASHMKGHIRKSFAADEGESAATPPPVFEAKVIVKSEAGMACPMCYKMYHRKDHLRAHIEKMHPEPPAPTQQRHQEGHLQCRECDRTFTKENALTIHMKVHERAKADLVMANNNRISEVVVEPKAHKFSCGICHQGFDVPKQLKEHIILKHPF